MENMSPEKLILIASTISLELVQDKSAEEINFIKSLLSLICNNLQTYYFQKLTYEKNLSNNDTK